MCDIEKLMHEELYGDADFKRQYLNTLIETNYSKSTLKTNYFLLKNIGFMENLYNKDFYDFNLDETKKALKNLRRKNLVHIASDGAMLRKYALYAVSKKRSIQNTHPMERLSRSDLKSLLVETSVSDMYATYEEYKDAVSSLRNWTDKALMVLIWNGVTNKNHEAIRNITKYSFANNCSTLIWHRNVTDEDDIVSTRFESWESHIIRNAFLETQYKVEESKVAFGSKIEDVGKLHMFVEGNHLFRNFVNKKNLFDVPVQSQIISNRFKHIKLALGKQNWRINNIAISGLIYRLLKENSNWSKFELRTYLNNNPNLSLSFDNFYGAFDKLAKAYNGEE